MKSCLPTIALAIIASSALAQNAAPSALSLPGYFGSINNNTDYVIECSQVIGGYCANNPMPANGYIQMLPDPGSKQIRGHVMIYQKDKPGAYLDNLTFIYSEQKNGSWSFNIKSLYNKVNINPILPDTLLLEQKTGKQS